MLAIRVSRHGGPEVLEQVSLPMPTHPAGPDADGPSVLVHVTHVGLNHLDVWVRRGVAGHRFPLPLIPGSDVVGVREDTGEAVALQPGVGCGQCVRCQADQHSLCRHYGIRGETFDGGMCQWVQVPEAHLLPLGALDPAQAAGVPLALLTAWHMVVTRAQVGPGDRVLVQAGASGVGSFAIQVARLRGARVVATASTEAKRAHCMALGAEAAWSYETAVAEAKTWTGKAGVDVVVDHVGQATWAASTRMLRWGGTYVSCGATSGHKVSLDLRAVFFKQLSILGSTMGGMGEMRAAWAHVRSGEIQPVVRQVLSMRQLGAAHALLEERAAVGKVVVRQDLGGPPLDTAGSSH